MNENAANRDVVGWLPSAGVPSASSHGASGRAKNAGLGNPAYNGKHTKLVRGRPPLLETGLSIEKPS
jgi:hypothetical protein